MAEEKIGNDRIVSERMRVILSDTSLDFSVKGLQKIHLLLFNQISSRAGEFRNKFNPRKKETVLQGSSVIYADYADIELKLTELLYQEQSFDYSKLSESEKISHIISFFSDLWRVHPFYDGNTRTITMFIIKMLRGIGFDIDNEQFERNAGYLRDSLVRSAYETKSISRDFSFLEDFLTNVVNGKKLNSLSSDRLIIKRTKKQRNYAKAKTSLRICG